MTLGNNLSAPASHGVGRGDLARRLGTAAVLSVGLAFGAARYRRAARARTRVDDGSRALATYLREHLSGSDAAFRVVSHLRGSYAGTKDGRLFATLVDQFQYERELVRGLLVELGASTLSPKRVAAQLTGSLLETIAGGRQGDLSLFRTLEALLIGVQGKRCMWRALQALDERFDVAGPQRFAELEAIALGQWEAIEERRQSLVCDTFSVHLA